MNRPTQTTPTTPIEERDREPEKVGRCWRCPVCDYGFVDNKDAAIDCRDSHFQGLETE